MNTESPIYFTLHGGNGIKCIFLDLGIDGLSLQFHGEKEQTSIHLPSADLQGFHNWMSARFGLPCQQVPDDFLATLKRVRDAVGPLYRYKGGDKSKIRRGVATLEKARER